MEAQRPLLACSGGGHLKQLLQLLPRMSGLRQDAVWMTFDTGLSRGVLADAGARGQRVVLVPYAAPRDVPALLRIAATARKVLDEEPVDVAVSTGAGIALAVLPLASRRGIPAHYIESATRIQGPSLTGRTIRWSPGVHLYTQQRAWVRRPWRYAGSVFDGFERSRRNGEQRPIRRAVVTVGTTESYGFRRLIERVRQLLPADAEVLWQTGATDTSGLGIDGRPVVPAEELHAAIAESDVVIAHAGTGIALTAFELGRCPVLVPRERAFDEHVDDHQVHTATMLAARGLAVTARADQLGEHHLADAAASAIRLVSSPPPFRLSSGARQ
ncbi:MAG TPA: glycosyltransferase [Nitriliruptorales bacterium]|nr:glycosyltransferase [Nitriliruptorales bacterium]